MRTIVHPVARSTARTRSLEQLATICGWSCWFCGCTLVPMGTPDAVLCVVTDPFTGLISPLDGYRWPELEHDLPRCRGGSDDLANLGLACGPCNQEKATRTTNEWYADTYGADLERLVLT